MMVAGAIDQRSILIADSLFSRVCKPENFRAGFFRCGGPAPAKAGASSASARPAATAQGAAGAASLSGVSPSSLRGARGEVGELWNIPPDRRLE